MEGSITMGENMFGNTMWAGHWLWMLVIAIVVVIPAWRICQQAKRETMMIAEQRIPVARNSFLREVLKKGRLDIEKNDRKGYIPG